MTESNTDESDVSEYTRTVYICGAETEMGRECRAEVPRPEMRCYRHRIGKKNEQSNS